MLKRARTACKAKSTRFSNKLFELIEQTAALKGGKIQGARGKLKVSFDESVELSLN